MILTQTGELGRENARHELHKFARIQQFKFVSLLMHYETRGPGRDRTSPSQHYVESRGRVRTLQRLRVYLQKARSHPVCLVASIISYPKSASASRSRKRLQPPITLPTLAGSNTY